MRAHPVEFLGTIVAGHVVKRVRNSLADARVALKPLRGARPRSANSAIVVANQWNVVPSSAVPLLTKIKN